MHSEQLWKSTLWVRGQQSVESQQRMPMSGLNSGGRSIDA